MVANLNNSTNANSLIQEQVANMLVQPLEAESVVLSSGVTVFNSSEPLRIPRLVDGFTPAFVAEGAEIPVAAPAEFSEIKLMPSERKGIKAITVVTNELIREAVFGVQNVLQQRIVKDVSNALDTALLVGDGKNDTITGIINQPGVTTGTFDPEDPDSFLEALALASSLEVKPNRWILNGQDFFGLRKVKDSDGRYLIQETLQEDVKYRLFGVPVTVTNKIPAGKAILADMSQVAVVRDIDPHITILNERYAEYDSVGIRVTTRYDEGLLHPEGVIVLTKEG